MTIQHKNPPANETCEVLYTTASKNHYLITYNHAKHIRVLYQISENGTLKKVATGNSPTDLYPKAL